MAESVFTERPPFFVVGSDRSGTTMLMMMLDAHPSLGVSRESWFLTDLMDALPLHGSLSREQVDKAFEIISRHPRWQRWGITDNALSERLAELTDPNLAELVEAAFLLDLERSGKTRWGDKTPAYVREIGRIHSLFPKAQFIHIIRDARDVCISLRSVGWHGPTLRHMAQYWGRQVITGIEAGRALDPGAYLEIPYEKLVVDTEEALRQICSFLGEPFDTQMLMWYDLTAKKTAARPMKFQTKLGRAPRSSDVGRWKNELSAFDIAVVEAYAGEAMGRAHQELHYGTSLRLIRPLLGTLDTARALVRRAQRSRIWNRIRALRQRR